MIFFKTKREKQLESEVELLKAKLANEMKEHQNLEDLCAILQNPKAGRDLIDKELRTKSNQNRETLARLLLLRETTDQINYRSVVTRYKKTGDICIDPDQIPLSRYDMELLMDQHREEIDSLLA